MNSGRQTTRATTRVSLSEHGVRIDVGEALLSMGLCVSRVDVRRSARLNGGLLITVTLWRSECLNALLVAEKFVMQKIGPAGSVGVEFFWRYTPRNTELPAIA